MRFAVQRKAASALGGEHWLTICSFATKPEADRLMTVLGNRQGDEHRILDRETAQ